MVREGGGKEERQKEEGKKNEGGNWEKGNERQRVDTPHSIETNTLYAYRGIHGQCVCVCVCVCTHVCEGITPLSSISFSVVVYSEQV